MNKKFLNAILCGTLLLSAGTFSSCKDYDDDIDTLQKQMTEVQAATKKLQEQVEDAITNGKWIDRVSIDENMDYVLQLTNKSGEPQTITIPHEGASTIHYFRVGDEQASEGEGASGQKVWKHSTNGQDWEDARNGVTQEVIPYDAENANLESIQFESDANATYIKIGDARTNIKAAATNPLVAIDEHNEILVVKIGQLNYVLLMKDSIFRGLNSVQYRSMQAFNDCLVAVTLTQDGSEERFSAPALAQFRVLPAKKFDVAKASFVCQDLHPVTRADGPTLTAGKAEVDDDGILKLHLMPSDFTSGQYYKAVLDVTVNRYTVTSDYFTVKTETHDIANAIWFCADGDTKGKSESEPIIFNRTGKYLLNNINNGLDIENNGEKISKSFEELGFTTRTTYTPSEGFTLNKEEEPRIFLTRKTGITEDKCTVEVKTEIMDGETVKMTVKSNVYFETQTTDIAVVAVDDQSLEQLESLYGRETQNIELKKELVEDYWDKIKEVMVASGGVLPLKYLKEDGINYVYPTGKADDIYLKFEGEGEDEKLYLHIEPKATFAEGVGIRDLYAMEPRGKSEPLNIDEVSMKSLYIPRVHVEYVQTQLGELVAGAREGDGNDYYFIFNDDRGRKPISNQLCKMFIAQKDAQGYPLYQIELRKVFNIKPKDLPVKFSFCKKQDNLQVSCEESDVVKKLSLKSNSNHTLTIDANDVLKLTQGTDLEQWNVNKTDKNATNPEYRRDGIMIQIELDDEEVAKQSVEQKWFFYDPVRYPLGMYLTAMFENSNDSYWEKRPAVAKGKELTYTQAKTYGAIDSEGNLVPYKLIPAYYKESTVNTQNIPIPQFIVKDYLKNLAIVEYDENTGAYKEIEGAEYYRGQNGNGLVLTAQNIYHNSKGGTDIKGTYTSNTNFNNTKWKDSPLPSIDNFMNDEAFKGGDVVYFKFDMRYETIYDGNAQIFGDMWLKVTKKEDGTLE